MLGLIARRVLQMIPILFGVTALTFIILNVLPGNVVYAILGGQATTSSIKNLTDQLGLNHPLADRYWLWLDGALHGNLGHSLLSSQSVSSIILQRAPVSLELAILAILIALVVAIPFALLSASRPGGVADRIATAISMVAISMPSFVLALLLILVFAVKVHLVQPIGFTPISQGLWSNLHTMILPALTVAFLPCAIYLRVLRGDMVRSLTTEHYVDTARAKGLSERRILLRHVLPNSIFGLVTVVAVNVGTVIGVLAIVEQIFSLPGLGQTLVEGIYDRDAPVVQGIVVTLAVTVVAANLLADLLYVVIDPRLRHGA